LGVRVITAFSGGIASVAVTSAGASPKKKNVIHGNQRFGADSHVCMELGLEVITHT